MLPRDAAPTMLQMHIGLQAPPNEKNASTRLAFSY